MSITSTYYRNAVFALVVFDLTDRASFVNTARWFEDLNEKAPAGLKTVLVGNKKDLVSDRQVDYDEGVEAAAKSGAEFYYEVSALTGDGIMDLFVKVAELVQEKAPEQETQNVIEIEEEKQDESCC